MMWKTVTRGAAAAALSLAVFTPYTMVAANPAETPTPEPVTVDIAPQDLAGTQKVFVPYVGVMTERRAETVKVQQKMDVLEAGQTVDDGSAELLAAWSNRVYAERRQQHQEDAAERQASEDADARIRDAELRADTAEKRALLAEKRLELLEERLTVLEEKINSGEVTPSSPDVSP